MKHLLFILLFTFASTTLFAQTSDLKQIIDERADEIEEEVIEWRRHFH